MKSASLVRTGLSDDVIAKLDDWEDSDLPEAWKAALALADHLSGGNAGLLSEAKFERLREHFEEPQILMLGALLAVGSGWQTMIETFGIRPDHFEPGNPPPWQSGCQ